MQKNHKRVQRNFFLSTPITYNALNKAKRKDILGKTISIWSQKDNAKPLREPEL